MVYKLVASEVIGFDSKRLIEVIMLMLNGNALAQLQLLPVNLALNLLQICCLRMAVEVEMLAEYSLPVQSRDPIITNLRR